MALRASHPFVRPALAVAAVVVVLAVLRPWTVRPLHVGVPDAFDAAAYARQAWPKILDDAMRSASDVSSLPAVTDASPRAVFVKLTGTLTAIDRRSRVGVALVRLDQPPGTEAAILVGPVIRGTALRDAASFIRFTDFTNQFEFAAVSNALHDRVLAEIVARAGLDALQGRVISVVGATKLPAAGGRLEIVPIAIVPARATR